MSYPLLTPNQYIVNREDTKRGPMLMRRLWEYILLPLRYTWWKSIIERILALLAIVVLSPLLVLIALGIRIDSPGNPVFRQERIGRDGNSFTIYKFRTMYTNNDDSKYKEFLQKYVKENADSRLDEKGQDTYELVHDPRVTRLGYLLRKTSLDEVPQLFNVAKGDMALIGPRPDIPFTAAMYNDEHRQRLLVKPGITGLWQVSGRRSLTFDDMVRLDCEYIDRQSPFLDAKIVLLTVREVLMRDKQSV
jgi:lipopolysaccharide/colanic/teichoic acid biosynthesis glycosyltransferase